MSMKNYDEALNCFKQGKRIDPSATEFQPKIVEAQKLLNAQKEKKPFFIYLPFSHVHVPLATDPKFINTSARGNVFGDVLMELDHAVHSVVETVAK